MKKKNTILDPSPCPSEKILIIKVYFSDSFFSVYK